MITNNFVIINDNCECKNIDPIFYLGSPYSVIHTLKICPRKYVSKEHLCFQKEYGVVMAIGIDKLTLDPSEHWW